MSFRSRTIVFLAAVMLVAGVAEARGKKPVLEPGKYKEWGQDIDEMEIIKPFHLSDYSNIAVVNFDTSAVPLPDQNDKSYAEIKSTLGGYTETLVEGMKKAMKGGPNVSQATSAPKDAKTLIVRGSVDNMSPGSRTKRYLAGYGAGAGGNKVHGEIVDAKTGTVLARFSQERRSGGTFKFGGGSDIEVMRDSIHAIAEDIVHILTAFE